MSFQSTTLMVASVVLAVALLLITFLLYKQKQNYTWPPEIGSCPDYWEADQYDQGKCNSINKQNLGSCVNETSKNFASYVGASGLLDKRTWAEGCGITWDGITNIPRAQTEINM